MKFGPKSQVIWVTWGVKGHDFSENFWKFSEKFSTIFLEIFRQGVGRDFRKFFFLPTSPLRGWPILEVILDFEKSPKEIFVVGSRPPSVLILPTTS